LSSDSEHELSLEEVDGCFVEDFQQFSWALLGCLHFEEVSLSLSVPFLSTLVTFFSLVADEGFVIDESLLLSSASIFFLSFSAFRATLRRAISALFATFLPSF